MTAPVTYTREQMAYAVTREADYHRQYMPNGEQELTLRAAAAALRQAAAEGQGKCAMGVYCREHNFIHGFEAEELRERFEKLADDWGNEVGRKRILRVLDDVDARDSATGLATPTEPTPPPAVGRCKLGIYCLDCDVIHEAAK